jgi:hypothetical protein
VVPAAGGALDLADPAASELYDPAAGPEEIAAAIDRLLARPRTELRDAACERARAIPSMADHFQRLASTYTQLLDGPPRC